MAGVLGVELPVKLDRELLVGNALAVSEWQIEEDAQRCLDQPIVAGREAFIRAKPLTVWNQPANSSAA